MSILSDALNNERANRAGTITDAPTAQAIANDTDNEKKVAVLASLLFKAAASDDDLPSWKTSPETGTTEGDDDEQDGDDNDDRDNDGSDFDDSVNPLTRAFEQLRKRG